VHTAFACVDHPVNDWSLDVSIAEERRETLQLERIQVGAVSDAGAADVTVDNGGRVVAHAVCRDEVLFAAPADFLAGLLNDDR